MAKSIRKTCLIAAALAVGGAASAAHAQSYTGPGTPLAPAANQAVWAQYCVGNAATLTIPAPNYQNPEVFAAAQMLSKIKSQSFYFYDPIIQAYQLKPAGKLVSGPSFNIPDPAKPGKTKKFTVGAYAHAFLVQLCGEFRDRATMVQAKVRWVNNTFILPNRPQGAVNTAANVNIWSQLTAYGYAPYLAFSNALYAARQATMSGPVNMGGGLTATGAVPPMTVCETKYVVSQFVPRNAAFPGLAQFTAGFKTWAPTGCAAADHQYFYDFRGDSNFKPQSPESNGMLWYGNGVAGHCASMMKSADTTKVVVRDQDCQTYFSRPFTSRWNGARAGLAAWLLHDSKYDAQFSNSKIQTYVMPNLAPWAAPFGYLFDGDKTARAEWVRGNYAAADLGMNALAGFAGGTVNTAFMYARLRDAVNRHTDWYASGWAGVISRMNRKAYSPFVASSCEMSKSDAFTAPGYTVGSAFTDHRKHWMFIFRVPVAAWYNSNAIAAKTPLNLDSMWLDETSLGTVGLAKAERAFDRLGTALETELDSILYLHNISDQGQVVGNEQ